MQFLVTSNKGKRTVDVPRGMNEVTTDQYQKLVKTDRSVLSVYSVLCGVPESVLSDIVSPELENALVEAVGFLKDDGFKSNPVPQKFMGITLPKKIGLSIGQSIHVRQKLDECKVYEECISFAIAMYLQPLHDNSPFDFDAAVELHEEILKMPITETYSLGFFLLSRMRKRGNGILDRVSRTFQNCYRIVMREENN